MSEKDNSGHDFDLDFDKEDFPTHLKDKPIREYTDKEWKEIKEAPLKDLSGLAEGFLEIAERTNRTASEVLLFMSNGPAEEKPNYCPHCGEEL